jgi:microcin C transport system substrate-binding protein
MTANGFNRRHFLASSAGLAGSLALGGAARAAATPDGERHGLSTFGELALPPDFPHFGYVNPQAPKGGTLALQVKQASGNQNLETFDTLNIFTFKGNGAAGMDMVFDTLMAGSGDEPDSLYGLVARAVTVSEDRLTYRFLLRPVARFHVGSALTAEDAAFSLILL